VEGFEFKKKEDFHGGAGVRKIHFFRYMTTYISQFLNSVEKESMPADTAK
jgi:hypothetical protein